MLIETLRDLMTTECEEKKVSTTAAFRSSPIRKSASWWQLILPDKLQVGHKETMEDVNIFLESGNTAAAENVSLAERRSEVAAAISVQSMSLWTLPQVKSFGHVSKLGREAGLSSESSEHEAAAPTDCSIKSNERTERLSGDMAIHNNETWWKLSALEQMPNVREEFVKIINELSSDYWRNFALQIGTEIAPDIAEISNDNNIWMGSSRLASLLVTKLEDELENEGTLEEFVDLVRRFERIRFINCLRLSECTMEFISAGLVLDAKKTKSTRLSYLCAALSREKQDQKALAWLLVLLLVRKAKDAAASAVNAWPQGLQKLPRSLASVIVVGLELNGHSLLSADFTSSLLTHAQMSGALATMKLSSCYFGVGLMQDCWIHQHLKYTLIPALSGVHANAALHDICLILLLKARDLFCGDDDRLAFFTQVLKKVEGGSWSLAKTAVCLAKQMLPEAAIRVVAEGDTHVVGIGFVDEETKIRLVPSKPDAKLSLQNCYAPLLIEMMFSKDFDRLMEGQLIHPVPSLVGMRAGPNSNGGSLSCQLLSSGTKKRHRKEAKQMDSSPRTIGKRENTLRDPCSNSRKKKKRLSSTEQAAEDEIRNNLVILTAKFGSKSSVNKQTKINPKKIWPLAKGDEKMHSSVCCVLRQLKEPTHEEVHEASYKLNAFPDDHALARSMLRFFCGTENFCEWTLLGVVQSLRCRGRPLVVEWLAREAINGLSKCLATERAAAVSRVLVLLLTHTEQDTTTPPEFQGIQEVLKLK
ncbi:Hypothetical predicted protein [Cloeon dipterum]|uniref:Uncharacterized protein n=1 Tax=Cloeon dipterum TaxID=197152 RepID=A0A8S1C4B3_9INSE|nr:Hypothetical predicted protein [Cloeon dipterum]